MEAYENLANAIIEQAAMDFRKARKKLERNPDNTVALRTVREVEKFFCSKWFTVLSKADGPMILEMLKEEFE